MFTNRQEAGRQLAEKINGKFVGGIIIGLARGGVIVATEIAKAHKVPLMALVVKKILSPDNRELGIGAVAPDNITFVDWKMVQFVGADEIYVRNELSVLSREVKLAQQLYGSVGKKTNIRNYTVILTDDGVATGGTVKAAIKWLKAKSVKRIVLALPVATSSFASEIAKYVDEVVILEKPSNLKAVGDYYRDFSEITQEEALLCVRRFI
jgi:putative phosphoribosyl transferase